MLVVALTLYGCVANHEQFMTFQLFGKTDVKVVEAVDWVLKSLVILFSNEEVIVSIIDSFDIELSTVSVVLIL